MPGEKEISSLKHFSESVDVVIRGEDDEIAAREGTSINGVKQHDVHRVHAP